jgi:HK97 family phage major capsid protein
MATEKRRKTRGFGFGLLKTVGFLLAAAMLDVGENGSKTDAMINRLEREVDEREAYVNGTVARAQDEDRDLTPSENEMVTEARKRVEALDEQLETLRSAQTSMLQARSKASEMQRHISAARHIVDNGEIEYRSAGEYALDQWKAALNDRPAQERLEVYHRAAAHQKTTDNLGIIPTPIVGGVLNYIDSGRPLVNLLGPKDLPAATWFRPLVTQGTSVAVQGSAGGAADEKAELVSQKMLITKLQANAVTYGGYVNVSRQDIDFSNPSAMDAIINDLAGRYAIQTETALGTNLDASTSTNVGYGASPTAATIRTAIWTAVGTIYAATGGLGRVVLALSPGRLPVFGPLFVPIVGVAQTGDGLSAGDVNQGLIGTVAGVPTYMSAGLGANKAFLFSTAAAEVYEQRVGALQVVEPSVLGVQVAYAGYFTPLRLVDNGVIELTAT